MQALKVYQSLWAMELRHPGLPERSAEENLMMIAEAGFDGVCLDPATEEIDKTRALAALCQQFGLRCMLNVFPTALEDMPAFLQLATDVDASVVNVIGGVTPLTVEDTVQVVAQWLQNGRDAGIPLLFETHRNSTLNDLYATVQIMDALPDLRLCADLSHYVVDREMPLPVRPCDQRLVDRVIARSDCLQGRVACAGQIQVQLDFAQHQPWVTQFRAWWQQGMRAWRARNAGDAELIFLCELGPPPYAITDVNGEELSDRWRESLTLKRWATDSWQLCDQSADESELE